MIVTFTNAGLGSEGSRDVIKPKLLLVLDNRLPLS
jgi:hypothetical protein